MIIYCQVCGERIEIDYIGRDTLCPNCGSYLHSCIQCEFYDPNAYKQCREPSADYVSDKEKLNFCEYFKPKQKKFESEKKIDPDALLKKLLNEEKD